MPIPASPRITDAPPRSATRSSLPHPSGRAEQQAGAFEAFEAAVAGLDEVIEVPHVFGLPDYVLRDAIDSIESHETSSQPVPADVPGVDKLDSHMTRKLIKSPDPEAAPPHDHPPA